MKKIICFLIALSFLGCKPESHEPQTPQLNLVDNTVDYLLQQKHTKLDSPYGLNIKFHHIFSKQESDWKNKYPTRFEQKNNPFAPEFKHRSIWLLTPNKVEIANIEEDGRYFVMDGKDSVYVKPINKPDPVLYAQEVYMVMLCTFKYDDDAWFIMSSVHDCKEGHVVSDQLYAEIKDMLENKQVN